MKPWRWDNQQGKFVPDTLGEQPAPHGHPPVVVPEGWGKKPVVAPYQPPYSSYSQPGGTAISYTGVTGVLPQQYGQSSLLGLPEDYGSYLRSNLNFDQNQQRGMGMRKGSAKADGQRHERSRDVEKDRHRDNKLSGQNKRGQGQGGRKGGTSAEKDSEVDSDSGSEENNESEEDYSSSEDTDTEITESSKRILQEFKTSTDSLRKEKAPQKKSMQDPGDHKALEISWRYDCIGSIIEEKSPWIEQGIADKGQSSAATEMPPSVQVPEDSEDDRQDLQDEEEF